MKLPELVSADPRLTWSIRVEDLGSGDVLIEHGADTVLQTASVGKVFLLLEVARRLEEGTLDPGERIVIPPEHFVGESGLLYLLRDRALTVVDAALMVAAVSDNLATNALLHRCGLDAVVAMAPSLGLRETSLLDYIRNGRGPSDPWTPSYGCARELCALMGMLSRGEAVSPGASRQVLDWLAAGVDTSMVANGLLLDPLAHIGPEYLGIDLKHKTGCTSVARVDVGLVAGPAASLAYAIGANWVGAGADLRLEAHEVMLRLGVQLREVVTGAVAGGPVGFGGA
ncbi:serine hydrolase [Micrococcales bacterium 31B]|nr:serine hydrolase [Micrococcales bacterium 31B]